MHCHALLCCAALCVLVLQYAEGVVLRTYLRDGRIPKSTELAELVNTEE
jgi:hypothetical protein